MIREFCDSLKTAIANENFPFVELVAGVVRAVTYTETAEDNKVRRIILPVSWDTNAQQCYDQQNPIRDLVPDSSKRGILYFEDNGASIIDSNVYGNTYQAKINLVCWYNKALILENVYGHAQSTFIMLVKKAIGVDKIVNRPPFTRVMVRIDSIAAQDNTTFRKYTYNETERQYLMPPYEFFNIVLNCRFTVPDSACFPALPSVTSPCQTYNF
jgi:hypothetical protein